MNGIACNGIPLTRIIMYLHLVSIVLYYAVFYVIKIHSEVQANEYLFRSPQRPMKPESLIELRT